VEDILEYMDETFNPKHSSHVKLLYLESIQNPDKLLKHASSLIRKGCKIAAIKAGSSQAGSRAAASHTGAMANSDLAVEALFRKAGIVRCFGREELTTVASVFMCKEMKGSRMAIITHAGGPAVMLTDALESGGLHIQNIKDSDAKTALKNKLYPGSSVENPMLHN
jgi:acyl-CoA synthetase (NDP forming)